MTTIERELEEAKERLKDAEEKWGSVTSEEDKTFWRKRVESREGDVSSLLHSAR